MARPEPHSAKARRPRKWRGTRRVGAGHPSATVEEPRYYSQPWRPPRFPLRQPRHRTSKRAESPGLAESPYRLLPDMPDCRTRNTTATSRAGAVLPSKAFPHTSLHCAVFCFAAAEPLRNMAFPYKARRATPLQTGPGVSFSYLPPGQKSFRPSLFDYLDSRCRATGCLLPCLKEVLACFPEAQQEILDYADERNFLRAVVL